MIVRTLMALCDAADCEEFVHLDPNGAQPYHELTRYGWSLGTSSARAETFCRKHGAS